MLAMRVILAMRAMLAVRVMLAGRVRRAVLANRFHRLLLSIRRWPLIRPGPGPQMDATTPLSRAARRLVPRSLTYRSLSILSIPWRKKHGRGGRHGSRRGSIPTIRSNHAELPKRNTNLSRANPVSFSHVFHASFCPSYRRSRPIILPLTWAL